MLIVVKSRLVFISKLLLTRTYPRYQIPHSNWVPKTASLIDVLQRIRIHLRQLDERGKSNQNRAWPGIWRQSENDISIKTFLHFLKKNLLINLPLRQM